MKRSVTPAFKQKNSVTKSASYLKVASQLKISNKDPKKMCYPKIIHNLNNNQCSSNIQNKQTISKGSSKNHSLIKNTSQHQKDFNRELKTQIKHFSPLKNPEQSNLTGYLISKSWENSSFILSNQVNHSMKKLVVQWIIELSHYMKLKRQTLYHSMWIFQRCIHKITDLNAKNLQLLAITCLFISAKYQQIYPPHIIALLQKTINSYHKKQVIQLQQKILIALDFQLTSPNRYTFLNLATNKSKYLEEYDKRSNKQSKNQQSISYPNQKRYIDFLHYILELTLLRSFPETYSQKQIGDSVIYLANKVMKRKQSLIQQQDWIYLIKIQQIAYEIMNLWKQNKNSIVSYLYDCDKWSFVGGLTILF